MELLFYLSSILPIFLLKLYSGKYKDCVGIVDDYECQFEDETCLMLKTIVFKQLREKLDVNIHLNGDADISVSEAIDLLFEYEKTCRRAGFYFL